MHQEKQNLSKSLNGAGQAVMELHGPGGTSALVLPYGARLLGLFPNGGANLLWVNPLLMQPETAIRFFQTPGWRNTGGCRTWLSPEREIHVVDLNDPWNSYRVTASIDPGNYKAEIRSEEVRLTTEGSVTHHRSGQQCQVSLEKSFRPVLNPFHQHPQRAEVLDGVSYAGIEQEVSLRYLDPPSASLPALSLWDAVNLPATGRVFVPTKEKTPPTDFFEPTSPTHLTCAPHGLSFLFDGRDRHKIAIHGSSLNYGRAGYLRQIGDDRFSFTVRNFNLEPSGFYLDTPWNDPADQGYVLECYNDGGANGLYGELEYHSAAMGPGTGRPECFDVAQLWGFEGSSKQIFRIVNELLGASAVKDFLEESW